jgi:hypothetical protein
MKGLGRMPERALGKVTKLVRGDLGGYYRLIRGLMDRACMSLIIKRVIRVEY